MNKKKSDFHPDIAEQNCILMYQHCAQCLKEKPPDVSASKWSALEAGWTEWGFQIWCKRHQMNVVHIDFEGVKHRAITTAKK